MAKIKIVDYIEIVEEEFWGDVWTYEVPRYIGTGSLASSVIVPLIEAVPAGEDIEVELSSCGGVVTDGWAIYNSLIAHKKKGGRIIISITAMAYSIASIIAMAGDEVIMYQASLLMIHKPAVCAWCFDSYMTDVELDAESNALKQIQVVSVDIYHQKSGLDVAIINEMINKETYITPSEAVAMGFADRIEGKVTEKVTITQMAFRGMFQRADARTQAYVNSFINIRDMATSKEALAKSKLQAKKSKDLLTKTKEFVNTLLPGAFVMAEEVVQGTAELTAGGTLYFDGDALAIGTEVFTDEERTTHPAEGTHDLDDGNTITVDAEGLVTAIDETGTADDDSVEQLRQQIADKDAEIAELTTQLEESTVQLEESLTVMARMQETASKYVPKDRQQTFKPGKAAKKEVTNRAPEKPAIVATREEREARRQELQTKKKV